MQKPTVLLPTKEVLRRTGFSRTTLYSKIKGGLFICPVKLGERNIGWPEQEVETLLRFIISEPSNIELEGFVTRVHVGRTTDQVQL